MLKEGYRRDPGEANNLLLCPAKLSYASQWNAGALVAALELGLARAAAAITSENGAVFLGKYLPRAPRSSPATLLRAETQLMEAGPRPTGKPDG